ncbi:protein DpdG [Ensifer sp. R-19]|uniref:protein DpdG n=1 Tax=Ensifer sp. R-19 TaxID=3404055 RepID=UPI003CFA3F83
MSIITTAQAVPSRLFAIYSSLFDSENGEVKERIEAWATPPSLASRGADEDGDSSTTLFSNTLSEARRMGLVEEIDGRLRLTDEARGAGKRAQDCEHYFREFLLAKLFDAKQSEEAQQSAFMLALSWFLSANPLKPMNFSAPPQIELRAEIGENADETELTSLNRYQNFLYWARYLGFATIIGGRDAEDTSSRRAVPDPVRAIDRVLPVIFSQEDELPIEQFLSRLAAIFPVFEKGSVRQQYDSMRLNPPANDASAHRLSIATSLALQRLADRQRLALNVVADAPARVLDFGIRDIRISHVKLRSNANA